MNFQILSPSLWQYAEPVLKKLKDSFYLRNAKIEQSFSTEIGWIPTFHCVKKDEIIICEISNRPYPPSVSENYADLISCGLPLRILIAYPLTNSLTTFDYHKDINNAKKKRIGYLSIDDKNNVNIEYKGLPLSYCISDQEIKDRNIKPFLKPDILRSFDTYNNGDPKHGVQELGQIIEKYMRRLAEEAKSKNKFNFNFNSRTNISKIIDNLITQNILDKSILISCRNFLIARNNTSHPSNNIKESKKINKRLKENYLNGLTIIEDMPDSFKKKRYTFKS
jgi:hypothetical protein